MLTVNSKMAKSGGTQHEFMNFTLPALKSRNGIVTCPMAGACAAGCYARQGAYTFGNVWPAHERNLQASLQPSFVGDMSQDIERNLARLKRSGKTLVVRIHDSGDFYSKAYLQKWLKIAQAYPRVHFYAYSKQVRVVKLFQLPTNLHIIFSFGGKEDSLIDTRKDAHSKVFETLAELKRAGYKDGSANDAVAAFGARKVGLVYHGAKSYTKTNWGKVA